MFNHKQVISDSFKQRELTITKDGSESLLIHCLKTNQPCSAGFAWIKGLSYKVPQEWHDPSEISEGLTHTYTVYDKNPYHNWSWFVKKLK